MRICWKGGGGREEPLGTCPNLYVEGVPVENVVGVFTLDAGPDDEGAVSFRIGKTLSEELYSN